jgi:TFIIF-interacting CTD phosphatase-like protein
VVFKEENGQERACYISLRPYAMTFLKKMSNLYDVVIFSSRSKAETDAILDALDPFNERCKLRLSVENCIRIKNIWTKDLRVIGQDLSQMLIVDHEPYSYLFEIDNAVPILPFHKGSDDQLYGLEKYLAEAVRSPDLRMFNRSAFMLYRYSECTSALDVVQSLYMRGR